MIKILAFGILFFHAVFCFGLINVPVNVLNWADIPRNGDPVTAGICLPSGTVYDSSKLRIVDGAGNTVPAQFKSLSKWWQEKIQGKTQNPSVKWVLCDFQPANVAATNKTTYMLKDDNSGTPAQTALNVTQDASAVTVVTGPLKFSISKTHFNLFDELYVDADNNGQFEPGEKVITSNNQNGGAIVAGNWPAGGCTDGTVHTTAQQAPQRVVIEEQGSMKVVLRIEGRHYAPSGGVSKGLYGYRVFVTAYAGKPYVDVYYAVTNTYSEFTGAGTLDSPPYVHYVWPFKSYKLNLNLNLTGSETYTLLGTSEVTGSLTGPMALNQTASAFTITGGAGGSKAMGGAAISNGAFYVMAAMRDFAPNSPKAFSLSPNKLTVELFPDAAAQPWYLDPFSRKSHRMRFEFGSGNYMAGALTELWKKTDAPLRMLASREWYQRCRAWERGFGVPPYPQWNRLAPSAWQRLTNKSGTWISYGIIPEFNGGGDHWNLTSCFWEYLQMGSPADFELAESRVFYFNDLVPVHFESTVWDDYKWFTQPEDHLQAFQDAPHPNYLDQLSSVTSFLSSYNYRTNEYPDCEHMVNMQELEYYLLTGDPATRDVVKEYGTYAVMGISYRTYGLYSGWPYSSHNGTIVDLNQFKMIPYGEQRDAARPLIVTMHAFEATGDTNFLYPMKIFGYDLRNLVRENPIGYMAEAGNTSYLGTAPNIWTANHPGVPAPVAYSASDFQLGIAEEALYCYWWITGDESVRDAVILSGKSKEWRAGKSGSTYLGFAYSNWADYLCDGKRYSDVGLGGTFASSCSEAFQGLIFGYMAGAGSYLWKVVTDGMPNFTDSYYPGGSNYERKIFNVWEAFYKHDSLDNTPPSAVSNLAAIEVPGAGIRLTWTAPGNDGNAGRAAEYQVKYAKAPIVDFVKRWDPITQTGWPDETGTLPLTPADLQTMAKTYQETKEVSFFNSQNVTGEPLPQAAGAAESFVVTGLSNNTQYYFAVVAIDSAGNLSGISNAPSCKPTRIEAPPALFNERTLLGCAPNPFNPSTTISFYLPASSGGETPAISLRIYNLQGKCVRTLVNGQKNQGIKSIIWNGRDDDGKPVTSGVYISKLSSGAQSLERTMVMTK